MVWGCVKTRIFLTRSLYFDIGFLSQTVCFIIISASGEKKPLTTYSLIATHKGIIAFGDYPISIKKLISGDLLIKTASSAQTKFFLQAKHRLEIPVCQLPQTKTWISVVVWYWRVIWFKPVFEILDGFSSLGVIYVRRKVPQDFKTKHLIITI